MAKTQFLRGEVMRECMLFILKEVFSWTTAKLNLKMLIWLIMRTGRQ